MTVGLLTNMQSTSMLALLWDSASHACVISIGDPLSLLLSNHGSIPHPLLPLNIG